jgi:hypothetical protein
MKTMKRLSMVLIFVVGISVSVPSRADFWGGDVAVLVQILANALQQLQQLREIMGTGQDTLGLLRDVNRGINDSLTLMQTAGLIKDPGVYKNWTEVQRALGLMGPTYGVPVPSADQPVQTDTDREVAEAVVLNNSVYDYTREIDDLAESIKSFSHEVSPGGAQKLTAQTLGVMLQVMNQGLRVQSTGLKLQAQTMAVTNKKEKASTAAFLANSAELTNAMSEPHRYYQIPRF